MRLNPKSLPFNPRFLSRASSKSFFLSFAIYYFIVLNLNITYVYVCLLFDSSFVLHQRKKKFFAFFFHYVTLAFSKLNSDLLRRRIISEKFAALVLRIFHRNFSKFLLRFDTDATERVQQQSFLSLVFCYITFDT